MWIDSNYLTASICALRLGWQRVVTYQNALWQGTPELPRGNRVRSSGLLCRLIAVTRPDCGALSHLRLPNPLLPIPFLSFLALCGSGRVRLPAEIQGAGIRYKTVREV